jgi:hypothetical protein
MHWLTVALGVVCLVVTVQLTKADSVGDGVGCNNFDCSWSTGHMAQTAKTPDRIPWLKSRCAQLVAFFDRYGVGRSENSDGPRNHTRIGAVIECERGKYRKGIDTMIALLVRKRFEIPEPDTPALEPEDMGALGTFDGRKATGSLSRGPQQSRRPDRRACRAADELVAVWRAGLRRWCRKAPTVLPGNEGTVGFAAYGA